jgi:DNA-binding MarR family transcriptional regulator
VPDKINEFTLQHFLPYRLVNIAERTSHALSTLYANKFDMTIPEWRILATLGSQNDLTAKTIGQQTQMDKVTVSRAINRLSDKAFINRQRDPHDGRAIKLNLSKDGSIVYKTLIPAVLTWEQQLTSEFTPEDVKQLHKLLSRLQHQLEKLGH